MDQRDAIVPRQMPVIPEAARPLGQNSEPSPVEPSVDQVSVAPKPLVAMGSAAPAEVAPNHASAADTVNEQAPELHLSGGVVKSTYAYKYSSKKPIYPVAYPEVYDQSLPTDRMPHPLEVLRYTLPVQERAAVYAAHCMKGLYGQYTPEMLDEGWDELQKVLDEFGFANRAELIQHVQTAIMPKVHDRMAQVNNVRHELQPQQLQQLLGIFAALEEKTDKALE